MAVLRGEVIARDGEPVGQPRGRLVRAQHPPTEATSPPDPLAFTSELYEVPTHDAMPATVFVVQQGDPADG